MEIGIIFEDEDLLVLEKPSGMTVNRSDTTKGERTVQEWVLARSLAGGALLGNKNFLVPHSQTARHANSENFVPSLRHNEDFIVRSGIVHRLDKETSGILLVAKNQEAFENLQKQFKERRVKKVYIALVHGKVVPGDGEIRVTIGRLPWNRKRFGVIAGGREAVTKYKLLSVFSNRKTDKPTNKNPKTENRKPITEYYSLLELYPETGRTHQIRVHLKHINHPIFSDSFYAGRKTARDNKKVLSRMFLHASRILFTHPKTNKSISFESKLPEDLAAFLETLRS